MSGAPITIHLMVLPGQRPLSLHLYEAALVLLGLILLALVIFLRDANRFRDGD